MVAPDRYLYIVAADPLARGGLAAVLAAAPGWEIVGSADPETATQFLTVGTNQGPDVLLWDTGWQAQTQLPQLLALISETSPLPVVALVDTPEQAAQLWHSGITGLLMRSAPLNQLLAALDAIAAGLAVWSPDLASALGPSNSVSDSLTSPLTEPLTPREMDVLELLAQGQPNKTIARQLGISEHTVKFHMNSILAKLNAQSRTEAVINAGRAGIIQV